MAFSMARSKLLTRGAFALTGLTTTSMMLKPKISLAQPGNEGETVVERVNNTQPVFIMRDKEEVNRRYLDRKFDDLEDKYLDKRFDDLKKQLNQIERNTRDDGTGAVCFWLFMLTVITCYR
jgi:hypothetical protein